MNCFHRSTTVPLATIVMTLSLVSGCSGGTETKWEGTYEQQNKDKLTLVLEADHKGRLISDGKPGEISWEVAGDDKIIIHLGTDSPMFRTADGNLRDDEGTVWKKVK